METDGRRRQYVSTKAPREKNSQREREIEVRARVEENKGDGRIIPKGPCHIYIYIYMYPYNMYIYIYFMDIYISIYSIFNSIQCNLRQEWICDKNT